jgi:hypothetical protein
MTNAYEDNIAARVPRTTQLTMLELILLGTTVVTAAFFRCVVQDE